MPIHARCTPIQTALFAAAMVASCLAASRPAQSRADEAIWADGKSVVLLRLEVTVDGKGRNALNPLSGFHLLLADLGSTQPPSAVKPLRSPSKAARQAGWVYVSLEPGDYFLLAVPPGRDQNPPAVVYDLESARYGTLTNTSISAREAFWNAARVEFLLNGPRPADFEEVRGFWFQVPGAGQTLYAGTLSLQCTGFRGVLGRLISHCAPIGVVDESARAEALLATLPGAQGGLASMSLVPYGELAPWVSQSRLVPLTLQATSVTDVDPGAAVPRKSQGVLASGGMAAGGVFTLVVAAAQGVHSVSQRAEADRKNEALAPCMSRLTQRMTELRIAATFEAALADALRRHGVAGGQAVPAGAEPADTVSDSPAGSLLSAHVSNVTLKECRQRDAFCVEVELQARLAQAGTGATLYAATLRHTSADVSTDPAARNEGMASLPASKSSACRAIGDYCDSDEGSALFEAELHQALAALADSVALRLAGAGP